MILISLIILIIITFSAHNDVRSVEELSSVLAIGLDISDSEQEPLSLTIQIVKPDTSEGGGTKIKTETKTVNCNSFNLGLAMLNLENLYELNLSHCSAIVISENLAKKGFETAIHTLNNNIEIRPTCNVLICQNSAKEFLETASKLEDVSARFYNSFINSANTTSYVTQCKLSDFYASTNNDVKEPVAIYSFLKDENIESLGLAVFKERVMIGRLSGLDTLCYNILTNNFDKGTIEVYNENQPTIPLTLSIAKSGKTKIEVKLEKDHIIAYCEISVDAKLLSSIDTVDLSSEKTQKQIESEINKFLEEHMLQLLYKTSKEYNSDIVGFKGFFRKNFLTEEELNKYNWDELFPQIEYRLNINAHLDYGSLFSKI